MQKKRLYLLEWQNVLSKSLAKSIKRYQNRQKRFTKEFIFSKVAALRLANLLKRIPSYLFSKEFDSIIRNF